jgi:hypothetical protein
MLRPFYSLPTYPVTLKDMQKILQKLMRTWSEKIDSSVRWVEKKNLKLPATAMSYI